jgi:hypothetical protein
MRRPAQLRHRPPAPLMCNRLPFPVPWPVSHAPSDDVVDHPSARRHRTARHLRAQAACATVHVRSEQQHDRGVDGHGRRSGSGRCREGRQQHEEQARGAPRGAQQRRALRVGGMPRCVLLLAPLQPAHTALKLYGPGRVPRLMSAREWAGCVEVRSVSPAWCGFARRGVYEKLLGLGAHQRSLRRPCARARRKCVRCRVPPPAHQKVAGCCCPSSG